MAVTQVKLRKLFQWLLDQPANSPETPYEIEITDFSASDVRDSHTVGTIGYTLNRRKAVYVDISATHLPDSEFDHVTSLDNSFQDCTSLVKAPSIPSCVTSALHTFQGCRNLKEAPAIPNTISNISYMFQTCTSLVNAPIIPESVTNMSWAFANCFSLVNAPILPSNLQNCKEAFMDCHSLDYKPVLPSNVTESTDCYKNVSTNYWKGTKSQAEICPYDCWFEFINNDKITVDFTCYNVGISTLSTWLSSQDNNDKEAPYVVYLRNLTTSNYSNIKTALQANSSKYVDLHYTELPSGITSLSQCFYNCSSLIIPPQLPSTVRNISQIFRYCTNLKEAPVIPNGVLEMSYAFQSCESMTEMPDIPTSVTNLNRTFSGSGITSTKDISALHLIDNTMTATFRGCLNLTTVLNLPRSVTEIPEVFYNCEALVNPPTIPSGVTNLRETFQDCRELTSVPNIPSSVDEGVYAFLNCSKLKKIEIFQIPLNTLKNSTYFRDMFKGCTSLEQIGFKIEEDTWHIWRLKFGQNTVEGKIFDANGYVDIHDGATTQISVTKSDIRLPNKTDEIWFPDMSFADFNTDAKIDALIENVIANKYTYYEDTAIPPDEKYFVLLADNKDKVITNIGGGSSSAVDVVEAGNMNPVTSNAVALNKTDVVSANNTLPVESGAVKSYVDSAVNGAKLPVGTAIKYPKETETDFVNIDKFEGEPISAISTDNNFCAYGILSDNTIIGRSGSYFTIVENGVTTTKTYLSDGSSPITVDNVVFRQPLSNYANVYISYNKGDTWSSVYNNSDYFIIDMCADDNYLYLLSRGNSNVLKISKTGQVSTISILSYTNSSSYISRIFMLDGTTYVIAYVYYNYNTYKYSIKFYVLENGQFTPKGDYAPSENHGEAYVQSMAKTSDGTVYFTYSDSSYGNYYFIKTDISFSSFQKVGNNKFNLCFDNKVNSLVATDDNANLLISNDVGTTWNTVGPFDSTGSPRAFIKESKYYQNSKCYGIPIINPVPLSKTEYPELYQVVGDSWSAGLPSTQFGVPRIIKDSDYHNLIKAK